MEHLIVGLVRAEGHGTTRDLQKNGLDLARARRGLIFSRCTLAARRALFRAKLEAFERGGADVSTEDLLLGLIREAQEASRPLFPSVAGELSIRSCIEESRARESRQGRPFDLAFSDEVQKLLEAANGECHGDGDQYWISPSHLLAGILQHETYRAAVMLARHGIGIADAERQLVATPIPAGAPSGNERLLLRRSLFTLEYEVAFSYALPLYSLALSNEFEYPAVAWCYQTAKGVLDIPSAHRLLDRYVGFVGYRTIGDALHVGRSDWKLSAILWRLEKADPPTAPTLESVSRDCDNSLLAVITAKHWKRPSTVVEAIGRVRRDNWNTSVTIGSEQYAKASEHWSDRVNALRELDEILDAEYRSPQVQSQQRLLLDRILRNLALEAEYTTDLPVLSIAIANDDFGSTVVEWTYDNTNRELDVADAKRFLDSGLLRVAFRTHGFGTYRRNSRGTIDVLWQLDYLPGMTPPGSLDLNGIEQETDRRCIAALTERRNNPDLAQRQIHLVREISNVIVAMEDAISSHEFDKARSLSDQERALREELRQLIPK